MALFVFVFSEDAVDAPSIDEGGGSTATEPGSPTAPQEQAEGEVIEVEGGQPVGGIKEIEVNSGGEVKLVVRSDLAEEVHIHGYDLSKRVEAGGSVSFDFEADLEGVFEVELEQSHVQIAELTVSPG